MHSHLDIKVNGKSLVIPEDSSLSVEEKNPLFNDVTFFSYPMRIPVEGNREVLKNIAHRDSDMRAMDLEHADASISADGLPLNHGQVITQDGSEIKDTFEFNIDAQQQSFSELIGNLECQDVDITDKRILVGEKIGKIQFSYQYEVEDYYYDSQTGRTDTLPVSGRLAHTYKKTGSGQGMMDAPQALGFSFPGLTSGFPLADMADGGKSYNRDGITFYSPKVTRSFINVSEPYPSKPYCNSRVAYAHPDVKTNDDGTKETEGIVLGNDKGPEPEDYGQYWCLGADRQQSGLCFYVLFFLDCLFEQLGVTFIKDELLAIEDFTRLCFFTTKHEYDSVETGKVMSSLQQVNDWLRSRNCGGQISFSLEVPRPRDTTAAGREFYGNDFPKTYDTDVNGSIHIDQMYTTFPVYVSEDWETYMEYHRKINASFSVTAARIDEMYANSKNFPKASVSSVIKSLENSFGIRFLYDVERKTVTAKLLRNVYKSPQMKIFQGKVLGMVPVNEKITGVRVAYSQESESKEQRANIRNGVKDYDTDFDYVDYPEDRTIYNLSYVEIAKLVSATNRNVYVDQTTGNSYRVKINADAEDSMTLKPTLFQVGQNKGVEEGDCSEQNKDYVKELISDFVPVPMNVVNAMQYNNDENGNVAPILAPFLDVSMEHEYLEKRIQSVIFHDPLNVMQKKNSTGSSSYGFPSGIQLLCNMRMWLCENYDPTSTDSGNSPLQDIDWGLTIGVMRGPGSGYSYADDGSGSVVEISFLYFNAQIQKFLISLSLFEASLGDIYSRLTELSSNPNYGSDYMIVDLIGFTIASFKSEISWLYTQGHASSDVLTTAVNEEIFGHISVQGGEGSQVVEFDRNYDGFDNSKWRQTVGAYALASDTMDLKGALFDYNSNNEGAGEGERFSLQIRSWVQPSWSNVPLCVDDDRDQYGNIIHKVRSRGLYDSFLREHVHFLLNRKKYKVPVLCSFAQLLDIRNHWHERFVLDGKVGWIDKMHYNISKTKGVTDIELDFLVL